MLLVACRSNTGPEVEPTTTATSAPAPRAAAKPPLASPTSLEVTPAEGCKRKNRNDIINARTKETAEWVEVRCPHGDQRTRIEISFMDQHVATVSDYLARFGNGVKTLEKEVTVADGWIAVFAIQNRDDFLVETFRMIAGKPVGCSAALVPRDQVDRIIETCKSVSY